MRLDADQDDVERFLVAACGGGVGEEGFDLGRDHGEEGLVEVGAEVGRGGGVEVGCEFGDGVAETGAVLGGDVDGNAEGFAGAEEFEGGRDPVERNRVRMECVRCKGVVWVLPFFNCSSAPTGQFDGYSHLRELIDNCPETLLNVADTMALFVRP